MQFSVNCILRLGKSLCCDEKSQCPALERTQPGLSNAMGTYLAERNLAARRSIRRKSEQELLASIQRAGAVALAREQAVS